MSARYSSVRSDVIDYSFWLVMDVEGGMRFSRGEPDAKRNERKMKCSATLPKALFRTPELKATITVDGHQSSVFEIDVQAASEALATAIGCDVDLRVERPE